MDNVAGAASSSEENLRQSLKFASSFPQSVHPILTVLSHAYLIVSFPDCVRSAVMAQTLKSRQQKWRPFFAARWYPNDIIRTGKERALTKPRA